MKPIALPFGFTLARTVALETDRVHREQLWQQTGELTKKLADCRDQLELVDVDRRQGYELLKESREAAKEATARADLAERVVQSQAGHVEALQKSNDKLVEAMMEMRRAGYGLIADVLKEDLQEGAKSVEEEDDDAVSEDPTGHAAELG